VYFVMSNLYNHIDTNWCSRVANVEHDNASQIAALCRL
jgi:hypothetical protein